MGANRELWEKLKPRPPDIQIDAWMNPPDSKQRPEVGIYKRKQESKKEKTGFRPSKRQRKNEETITVKKQESLNFQISSIWQNRQMTETKL